MALTKVTGKGLDSNVVDSTKLSTNSVTETKIASGAVTSAKILDGTVSADDLSSSLDLSSKTVTLPTTSVTAAMLSNTLDLSSKTVTLPPSATATLDQNIALLGFKMAITDGLTVFNLVDGVVDEFEDQGGTDESASTNLTYNSTDDYYINSSTPDAQPTPMASYSAGFGLQACSPYTTGSITEPDTSTAQQNNPQAGYTASPTAKINIDQKLGTFTVPAGMTAATIKVWGAGGGAANFSTPAPGGGGGFSTGTLATTPGQVLTVGIGYGGGDRNNVVTASPGVGDYARAPVYGQTFIGAGCGHGGTGGGVTGVFTASFDYLNKSNTFTQDAPTTVAGSPVNRTNFSPFLPNIAILAGGGGGGSGGAPPAPRQTGGAGGGLTGQAGAGGSAQTSANGTAGGGGGGQSAGGQGTPQSVYSSNAIMIAADGGSINGGGVGYYSGAGGFYAGGGNSPVAGGGGSSYIGNPQLSSSSTEGGLNAEGGGDTDPAYVAGTNEGSIINPFSPNNALGEQGYVLITGVGANLATTTTSTIISDPFTSTIVPTTARIVVFEENVGTPTLNTDIIASISRNNGTNFTTATLTDSGYVTGSSGQRILTGTATISGQPSGQSMKWKLELANNTVKIHGVALQWK